MAHMKNILIILSVAVLLQACGHTQEPSTGLTPLPDSFDLSNEKLEEAITAYVQQRGAPPNSDYNFARTDLNGDGNREGIVLFKLPHTYWCGWDGCGMVVFKAGQNGFSPISTISNVRGPIYINTERHNGWRDIIIRISGASMKDKNVLLEFDGRNYPSSPMLAKTLETHLSMLRTEMFFR